MIVSALACAGDSEPSPDDDEPSVARPLYAISTAVFDDVGATSYVALTDSLEDQTIELRSAAEFPGWSSIAAHDGKLFVGGGEAPEITRYDVSNGGELVRGKRLSFGDYGLGSVSFSHNAFVDETTAHLRLEETSRIVWNQRNLSITDSVEAPEIARERDGLTISASNFEGIAVRDDGVLWPYFWHDEDWYEFHPQSQIAFYEPDGTLAELLDVPCPALNIASADEMGNVYFSGMVDTLAHQFQEKDSTLERCVARIDAGAREIADGWPRRFEELTGGRPAGRFYYLENGKGLLTVFHEERANFEEDEEYETLFSDHWGLWLVDLEGWSAEPIEDWGYGSSNLFFSRVDDRTFLHKVSPDFADTTVYEVKTDKSITEQITVSGYAVVLVRVR